MHKYGELLQKLLRQRGIDSEEGAENFLNPDYKRDLHDPFLMKDMERACVRVFEAIENKERIVIYADYDADGIPGAVIMQDLLRLCGHQNFEVYIPQRNSEGYGLNLAAIKQFTDKKTDLLLAIDLGITAVEEVAQAEVGGMDVIILDHHLPKETLPRAYAILNPKVDDPAKDGAGYPEKMLCAAGVVFKFAQGFIKKYGEYYKIKEGSEKWMLDMAGLSTLADMVPLTGENRAIAYFGLKVLRRSVRPGLQKLLAIMKIDQKHLTEDDVAFMIVPRLNAASRMDDPMRAYELLATSDEVEAAMLANHLSKINDERKTIVTSIMREVNKNFEKREINDVVVMGNPKWRVGVLGLVAGKIMDAHNKPVFVWAKDENDAIKGSCRSDGSVSVAELMSEVREHFVEFGGHELAGGFTVQPDKVHFLEEALNKAYQKVRREKNDSTDLNHDLNTDLGAVSMENWREIERLAPFGHSNPKPVFSFPDVRVKTVRKFGKNGSGEHLEIVFWDQSGVERKGVSFFSTPDSFNTPLAAEKIVNLLGTFDLSRYRGREELRLRIVDIL